MSNQAAAPAQTTSIWRGPLPIAAAIALVLGIVAGIFVFSREGQAPAPKPKPKDTVAVANQVASVPQSVLDNVRGDDTRNPLRATGLSSTARDAQGRPQVLYVGAEFCPYCAAERWPMVLALSRFGRFSDLSLTQSSSTDAYANTVTFTFHGSSYSSQYLSFESVELDNRNHQPLENMTASQEQQLARYDTAGSIPFLLFGGRWYQVGAAYLPDVLTGQSWQQVAENLDNTSSPSTQRIVASANYLIAALCELTGNEPAATCNTSAVKALRATLPSRP